MQRVLGERTWLLHTRKFTDSRILLDLLTENFGLVRGVYRTSSRRSGVTGPVQFTEMNANWRGGGELKTLESLERSAGSIQLTGPALYCGLYLNELLLRLLPHNDPHSQVFHIYRRCLAALQDSATREVALREFELSLLEALGYGVDFTSDVEGVPIPDDDNCSYHYFPDSGFKREVSSVRGNVPVYSGVEITLIGSRQLDEERIRRKAKVLCRTALNSVLGGVPLKSREFFSGVRSPT